MLITAFKLFCSSSHYKIPDGMLCNVVAVLARTLAIDEIPLRRGMAE